MNQRLLLLLLAIAVTILSACKSFSPQQPSKSPEKTTTLPETATNNVAPAKPEPEPVATVPPTEVDVDAERNALLQADLNFSRASEEKGTAQAFYEFLTPDGICLWDGEPPIHGRDAVKVHLAARPQGFFTWQPSAADVARSGDLGFTCGTAIFQSKVTGPDEKPRISHSKYVTIWKKQSNSRWKVVLFSTSPSPPPPDRRP
jgi:ketosteroid isomerase-like protein